MSKRHFTWECILIIKMTMHKNLSIIFDLLKRAANIPQNANIDLIFPNAIKAYNLNKKYRAKSKVPDILTFPYSDGSWSDKEPFPFGQIFLCIDKIESKVLVRRSSLLHLYHYLIRLLCHGIAHLKGYDHESLRDFKRMNDFENECKRKFYIQNRLIVINQNLLILPTNRIIRIEEEKKGARII